MSHRSRSPDRAVENPVFARVEPVTEKSGEKPPRGQARHVRCYHNRGRQQRAAQQVREDLLPHDLVVKIGHPRQDRPANRRMSPPKPDQEGS
jgi:hypothetical protein